MGPRCLHVDSPRHRLHCCLLLLLDSIRSSNSNLSNEIHERHLCVWFTMSLNTSDIDRTRHNPKNSVVTLLLDRVTSTFIAWTLYHPDTYAAPHMSGLSQQTCVSLMSLCKLFFNGTVGPLNVQKVWQPIRHPTTLKKEYFPGKNGSFQTYLGSDTEDR